MDKVFRTALAATMALPLLAAAMLPVRAEDTVRLGLAAVYPAYAVPNAAKASGY
jgi:hypothetical protein